MSCDQLLRFTSSAQKWENTEQHTSSKVFTFTADFSASFSACSIFQYVSAATFRPHELFIFTSGEILMWSGCMSLHTLYSYSLFSSDGSSLVSKTAWRRGDESIKSCNNQELTITSLPGSQGDHVTALNLHPMAPVRGVDMSLLLKIKLQ